MEQQRRKQPNNSAQVMYFILICLFLFITVSLIIKGCDRSNNDTAGNSAPLAPTDPIVITDPTHPDGTGEPYIVEKASIGVTGDIMGHGPVLKSVLTDSGEYDFTKSFRYIAPYFSSYDFMVANLEVTLGGPEAGDYKGYPTFNNPDSLIDGLLYAGIDMVTTATNHSYDTGHDGFIRTQEVLKQKGMLYTGTRLSETDANYIVNEINGIKIGMINYTYEVEGSKGTQKILNGIKMDEADGVLINSFNYSKMDAFYSEVETAISNMRSEGAEIIMFFIHWGNEYETNPSNTQKKIAQNLSNKGVDIIVGGHPHVIQPMNVLTAEDGRKTLCIYSVGNSISNQRRYEINQSPSGHTEDGIIFNVDIARWSDGTVGISDVNVTPLWVSLDNIEGKNTYTIIPVDVTYKSLPAISVFADTINSFIDPDRAPTSYVPFVPTDPTNITSSFNRTSQGVLGTLNDCRQALGLNPTMNTAGQ